MKCYSTPTHPWHQARTVHLPVRNHGTPNASLAQQWHEYVSLAHQSASLAPTDFYASVSTHPWHPHTHPWHHTLTMHPPARTRGTEPINIHPCQQTLSMHLPVRLPGSLILIPMRIPSARHALIWHHSHGRRANLPRPICHHFPRRHANIAHYRTSCGSGGKLGRLLGEWWQGGAGLRRVGGCAGHLLPGLCSHGRPFR